MSPGAGPDPSASTTLVIEREFDAPRWAVYDAFTQADLVGTWFGPSGLAVPRHSVELDPRVGGYLRLTMVGSRDPSVRSPVEAVFTEVVENALIVADERTEPLGGGDPLELSFRAEFTDTGPGRSEIYLAQGPFQPSMVETARDRWESSFTKLDALLEALYPAR